MKFTLKKVSVLTVTLTLLSMGLRYLQIVFCSEPATGFFAEGYSAAGIKLGVAIAVFGALACAFTLTFDKQISNYPEPTPILSGANIMLAITFLADLLFLPSRQLIAGWQKTAFYVLGVLSVLFLLLEAALPFIKSEMPVIKEKFESISAICAALPVIFYIVKAIIYFSFYARIGIVADIIFEILSILFTLIFMLCFGQLKSGTKNNISCKWFLLFYVSAFFFTGIEGVPKTFLKLFSPKFVHEFNVSTISSSFFFVFLILLYFSVFRAENLKDKPKRRTR